MASDPKPTRPFKIWSYDRQIKKAVVVSSFDELKQKACEKLAYDNLSELVVVLENDGTEVEDEIYFNTLEKDTVFLLLRPGEKWISRTIPAEQYSGDSYGIQIRDVTSGTLTRGSIEKAAFREGPRRIEKVTPPRTEKITKITPKQFHTYAKESLSFTDNDDFFVEPPKEDPKEAQKSTHHFSGLNQPKSANSGPAMKSILKTACRTAEDAIASDDVSDDISSDLPESASPAKPKTTRYICPVDERLFWSHDATQQLIRSYIFYRPHFDQPRGQLQVIWNLVAKKMQFHGFNVSARLCDKKWRNLKMTYRAIMKKMTAGSIKTRKSWQYFSLMREAMTKHVPPVSESEGCSEGDGDMDYWLAEFFHQRKEQELKELEEIRRVSHHSIEQLRKENESLQLLNDYLTSCVTK